MVAVKLVAEQCLSKSLLDFSFATSCVLPAGEADDTDDLVNFVYNPLHNDGRFLVANLIEKGCS